VNKALLDTDTYSEFLKAVNPTVAQNAAAYRQHHGVLTVSATTDLIRAIAVDRFPGRS
jgi:hypothetical protein